VASCTIIVTDANAPARPFHDRMPVLLAVGKTIEVVRFTITDAARRALP